LEVRILSGSLYFIPNYAVEGKTRAELSALFGIIKATIEDVRSQKAFNIR
jgi:hypothetical protein